MKNCIWSLRSFKFYLMSDLRLSYPNTEGGKAGESPRIKDQEKAQLTFRTSLLQSCKQFLSFVGHDQIIAVHTF